MPPAAGSCRFQTALGVCAISWSAVGVTAIRLPDVTATGSAASPRLPASDADVPPPEVRAAMDGIVALLDREQVELGFVVLDLGAAQAFDGRVYAAARAIPAGQVTTYGAIARDIGEPGAARRVGQALGRNPVPILVPCHRVLATGGALGGFSAPGGARTKLRLLEIEGAAGSDAPNLFPGLPLHVRPPPHGCALAVSVDGAAAPGRSRPHPRS